MYLSMLLYLILIYLCGNFLIRILNFFKIIDKRNISNFEMLGFSYLFGCLSIAVYLYIIGLIKISYSQLVFIPIFIISTIDFILIIINIFISKNIKIKFKNERKNKLNILLIVSFIIFATIVLYLFTESLSSNFIYPDEYSCWGTVPSEIFKSSGFSNLTSCQYPLFANLISSGYYILIDNIFPNMIRIFSPLIFLNFYFIELGRSKRKNYNIFILNILFSVLAIYFGVGHDILTSTYVDILYMSILSSCFLYLIEYIFETRNSTFLTVSILCGFCVSWLKPDGIYLLIIIFLLGFIINLFYKKIGINKIEWKKLFIFLFLTLLLGASWVVYQKKVLNNNKPLFETNVILPDDDKNEIGEFNKTTDEKNGTSSESSPRIHAHYIVTTTNNSISQLFSDKAIIIYSFLVLILLIVNYVSISTKSKYIIFFYIIFIIANYLFIILSFITYFGGEGLLAPSICRYMLRIFPILYDIILILSSNIFENNKLLCKK